MFFVDKIIIFSPLIFLEIVDKNFTYKNYRTNGCELFGKNIRIEYSHGGKKSRSERYPPSNLKDIK